MWLANYNRHPYSLQNSRGELNYKRFINTLDYSLDQIKLRDLYTKVYRRTDFTHRHGGKEYTARVINVTFKYAVCEWNRYWRQGSTYVRYDVFDGDVELHDCACVINGRLAAITVDTPVEAPLPDYMLGDCFAFEDGCYKLVKQPRKLKTVAELREDLYERGFKCGDIKYCRWKRSSGSSRVGKCLFIDEELFPRMHKWEMCGLQVEPGDVVDLAALESYISLTSSSIITTIHLEPKNILVISDWKSSFEDDVISVYEQDGRIKAKPSRETVTNNIFDGQGLMDASMYTGMLEGKGMALLRNMFFKCCCFNCNIQKWFADNGITEVTQLNGETLATDIRDIKLITTPSSIKYLKFGKLDKWLEKIPSEFGVVKTDKPSGIMGGEMVQTHYQLLNTLQMRKSDVQDFLKQTFDYMTLIKNRPSVLKHHIKCAFPHSFTDTPVDTRNDIIFKLMNVNEDFCKTKIYADFRDDILTSITKHIRLGKVWVNGTYATLLGNPVEMLKHAIGIFDGTTSLPVGRVHTTRFEHGDIILGSRSPHISMSNVWTPVNMRVPEITAYFNLTPEIICINSINENILNTLSGCDFDGDAVMITDNPMLISAALRNNGVFGVAVADIPSVKSRRKYSPADQADLDIKTSNNLIGDIVNLSQELNSIIWDKLNAGSSIDDVMDVYMDVCILNVMSGIEIDKAKKEVMVNNGRELSELRKKYKVVEKGRTVKPKFFASKDKGKGYYDSVKKYYKCHKTTMDFVEQCVAKYRGQRARDQQPCTVDKMRMASAKLNGQVAAQRYLSFSDIIASDGYVKTKVNVDKVNNILKQIDASSVAIGKISEDITLSQKQKYEQMAAAREALINKIGAMPLTRNTIIYMLKLIEDPEMSRYSRKLMSVLFSFPNECFYSAIKRTTTPVEMCERGTPADILLFGFPFKFVKKQMKT